MHMKKVLREKKLEIETCSVAVIALSETLKEKNQESGKRKMVNGLELRKEIF